MKKLTLALAFCLLATISQGADFSIKMPNLQGMKIDMPRLPGKELRTLRQKRQFKREVSRHAKKRGKLVPECNPPDILSSRRPCPRNLHWRRTMFSSCRRYTTKGCGSYYYTVKKYTWSKSDGERGYCEDDAYYESPTKCR